MKTLPIRPVPPTPGGQRPGADGPPVDRRWTVARLLTAPHRLGFFSAALMLATSALWWAVALAARQVGLALPWAVPPAVAHGLLMGMGNMPLFIVGFLFTAGPRWLGLPDVAARSLRWPVVAMLCGWAVALIGFHAHALVAALGIAAVAGGWSAIVVHFVGLVRRSPVADQLHARVIAAAAALGALALWAAAAGLATDQATAVRVATQAALWGCLAPVFWTVSHRMIPFFSASALPMLDAWRPNWLLWVGLAALAVAGAGAVADLLWWPLPPMLHGGFVWLGLALSLAAVSHGLQASGTSAVGLGLAPTHALTMGYLGCTLIAMITRVAAGHSGRPLAADNVAWALYWGLQTATLLRLGAVLWPAAEGPLVLLAVAAWAAATTGWAWRYGGWLGRPRIDGRPG